MYEISYTSPLGVLRLLASEDGLVGVYWPGHKPAPKLACAERHSTPVLAQTAKQLDAYFAGVREIFDLPLAPRGTPFQHAVWRALAQIPFGETRSYSDIAKAVGRASAVRAVAAANARNPLSIIVPCHRVIGKDGTLSGYAGGIETKRWLLAHEC
jgi:methylated-DNA-[protein]-cysteine S-methyltransferase